mgnify:CR=1 FL=1
MVLAIRQPRITRCDRGFVDVAQLRYFKCVQVSGQLNGEITFSLSRHKHPVTTRQQSPKSFARISILQPLRKYRRDQPPSSNFEKLLQRYPRTNGGLSIFHFLLINYFLNFPTPSITSAQLDEEK